MTANNTLSAEALKMVLDDLSALSFGGDVRETTALLERFSSQAAEKIGGLSAAVAVMPTAADNASRPFEAIVTLNAKQACVFAANIIPVLSLVLAAGKGAGVFLGKERMALKDVPDDRQNASQLFGVFPGAPAALVSALRPLRFVSSFTPAVGRVLAARGSLGAMVESEPGEMLSALLELVFTEAGGACVSVSTPGIGPLRIYGKSRPVQHVTSLLKAAV